MFSRLGAGFGGLGTIGAALGAGVVAWEPDDLGADLLAWWSADDLSDGVVTTWTDSIGAIAPTQATADRKPVRAATSFNTSYAGVTFDGSDDRLTVASSGSLPSSTASSEIHALVSQGYAGATTSVGTVLSYGTVSSHASRDLNRISTSSVSRLRAFDATTAVADTSFVFDGPHIVGGRFDAATATLWFDGRATSPASGAMAFSTIAGATSIGSSANGAARYWSGVIRHIFVTNVLSDANRQKLEGWMAHDSNLTSLLDVAHPYKSVAP
jgi:hypothetical protein